MTSLEMMRRMPGVVISMPKSKVFCFVPNLATRRIYLDEFVAGVAEIDGDAVLLMRTEDRLRVRFECGNVVTVHAVSGKRLSMSPTADIITIDGRLPEAQRLRIEADIKHVPDSAIEARNSAAASALAAASPPSGSADLSYTART